MRVALWQRLENSQKETEVEPGSADSDVQANQIPRKGMGSLSAQFFLSLDYPC